MIPKLKVEGHTTDTEKVSLYLDERTSHAKLKSVLNCNQSFVTRYEVIKQMANQDLRLALSYYQQATFG